MSHSTAPTLTPIEQALVSVLVSALVSEMKGNADRLLGGAAESAFKVTIGQHTRSQTETA